MPRHAPLVMAMTASIGVFGVLMSATGQAAPAGKHYRPSGPEPVATEDDAMPTEPAPIRPTPPGKAPERPSPARTAVTPTPAPTAHGKPAKRAPKHRAERKPKHRPSKHPKSPLRRGLERVLPDVKHLPDWALPIVADVRKHSVKGTQVQAYMNRTGKLVVWARVTAEPDGMRSMLRVLSVSRDDQAGGTGVDVRLVIEDPTTASIADPSRVTVTATDPETDTSVTRTSEVTAPEDVADVADDTMHNTVDQAADADTASVNG